MGRATFLAFFVMMVILCTCSADRRCGRGGRWVDCDTACPPTCKNPCPSGACIAVCREGCKCYSGYILRTTNGRCIRRSQC